MPLISSDAQRVGGAVARDSGLGSSFFSQRDVSKQ